MTYHQVLIAILDFLWNLEPNAKEIDVAVQAEIDKLNNET